MVKLSRLFKLIVIGQAFTSDQFKLSQVVNSSFHEWSIQAFTSGQFKLSQVVKLTMGGQAFRRVIDPVSSPGDLWTQLENICSVQKTIVLCHQL